MTSSNDTSEIVTFFTLNDLNYEINIKKNKHYIKAKIIDNVDEDKRLADLMSQEIFLVD